MRVAITGSTGFIGAALTAALTEGGHTVLPVLRGPREDPAALWNPAEGWIREGALEGVDAVVSLNGASIAAKPWTGQRKRELRAARIDSARVLVDHLASLTSKPRAVVCASAIGYYGPNRGDEVLTEASTPGPGFLAALVRDWEAEVARAQDAGIRVVSARFGITTDRHGELMQRLLPPFTMGVGGTIGFGRQWFSWIMVEDVARAIVFALQNDTLAGPVNITAPAPVTNKRFTKALGRALHRPTLFPIPTPALKLMFGRERAGETVLANQRVVPQKLLDAGFAFRYPEIEAALAHDFAR